MLLLMFFMFVPQNEGAPTGEITNPIFISDETDLIEITPEDESIIPLSVKPSEDDVTFFFVENGTLPQFQFRTIETKNVHNWIRLTICIVKNNVYLLKYGEVIHTVRIHNNLTRIVVKSQKATWDINNDQLITNMIVSGSNSDTGEATDNSEDHEGANPENSNSGKLKKPNTAVIFIFILSVSLIFY